MRAPWAAWAAKVAANRSVVRLPVVSRRAAPLLAASRRAAPLPAASRRAAPLLAVSRSAAPLLAVSRSAAPLLAASPLAVIPAVILAATAVVARRSALVCCNGSWPVARRAAALPRAALPLAANPSAVAATKQKDRSSRREFVSVSPNREPRRQDTTRQRLSDPPRAFCHS
jgi:hypothetical protein